LKNFHSTPSKKDFLDEPLNWCEKILLIDKFLKEKELREYKKIESEAKDTYRRVRRW